MASSEVPTASTEAIKCAFLTDEEVRQHSFLRVTDPSLLTQLGNPVAGGLYDKVLGPIDDNPAKGKDQRDADPGICQLLEKKEGLFWQKMMGKRVNYACWSVISPGPYLAVNEIGIPPYFAMRLTYPERVTPWNVGKLRNAIVNGLDIHPGATQYVDKSSVKMLRQNRRERISTARKLPSSKGVATQHGKGSDSSYENKVVFRHLRDGDVVLVNRQPTLHKPGIMAHVVRVLKGEKTIRMHYANCRLISQTHASI